MEKQLSPLFKFLEDGSFILLPLVYLMNALTFVMKVNKAGQEKCAALGGIIISMLHFFVWACHLLLEQFWNQVFVKPDTVRPVVTVASSSSEGCAMTRALFQVLGLMNDTPVSSKKYEFARALAEKLIMKNMFRGNIMSQETNRAALEAAFSRTVELLMLALQELQQQQEMKEYSWFWALIHSVFLKIVGIFQQRLSFEYLCSYLHGVVSRIYLLSKARAALPLVKSSFANEKGSSVCAKAEKLAQELLWVTLKLEDCSSLSEVTRRWGALPSLAKLSLSAPFRVQACLLRISVILMKDLAVSKPNKWSGDLKVDMLLLWLPLFCHAKIGFDYPCLMASEKMAFSKELEQNIFSLSAQDQERVLTCWLREYVSSKSDWPNLQECFEGWYFSIKT